MYSCGPITLLWIIRRRVILNHEVDRVMSKKAPPSSANLSRTTRAPWFTVVVPSLLLLEERLDGVIMSRLLRPRNHSSLTCFLGLLTHFCSHIATCLIIKEREYCKTCFVPDPKSQIHHSSWCYFPGLLTYFCCFPIVVSSVIREREYCKAYFFHDLQTQISHSSSTCFPALLTSVVLPSSCA